MATSKWVYRKSDGQYLRGGFYEPEFDPATEGVDEFPDHDPHPDLRLEKGPGRIKRSPSEIAIYDAQRSDSEASATINTNKTLLGTINYLIPVINELRSLHGLPPLTVADVKNGLKDKLKQL